MDNQATIELCNLSGRPRARRKRLRAPRVCTERCGQWVAYRYAAFQRMDDEHALMDGLLTVLYELRASLWDQATAATLRRLRSTMASIGAASSSAERRGLMACIGARMEQQAACPGAPAAYAPGACAELSKEARFLHKHALALLDEVEAGDAGSSRDLRIVLEHYRLVLRRIAVHEEEMLDAAEVMLTPADWRQIDEDLPLQLPSRRRRSREGRPAGEQEVAP